MALEMSMTMADMLTKVAMFVLVQALVYLILSNSSDIFSKSKVRKSLSFKPARSVNIRRMTAFISDLPQGAEASPSSSSSSSSSLMSPTQQEYPHEYTSPN